MIPDITETKYTEKARQSLIDEIAYLRRQLAKYEAASSPGNDDSDALSEALLQRDEDYQSLFAQFPMGMQEEDYSQVKITVDKLRAEGIENLKEYFESNPEILREVVGTTHITNVNKAMLEMTQDKTLQEYVDGDADIDSWWSDEWIAYYAAEIDALAGPDRLYEDERIDTRSDDSTFEVRTIATIVRGYEDSWEKVITIFDDITEQKENEKALIEAKSVAEQANRAKSEFLSSMSHELRTPLNAILGFSELIEFDAGIGTQHLSSVREISRAGQHLLFLIDEILDLSRIESGEVELSIEPVFAADVIEDCLTWLADLAESSGVSIHFDTGSFDQLVVLADAIKLKQIFLNLLTNAVKYNRAAGQVSVICGEAGEGLVRIGIRDTGPGISESQIDQLFKPFKRLGTEYSEVEGTGIGLVITQKLVALMQGRLEVDSTLGKGSTFWIELPKVQITDLEKSNHELDIDVSRESTLTLSTVKPCILVAEDNLVNRELIAAQMNQLGYQAEFAKNGAEALKLWQGGNYNLLMTDIRMPVMDGYELIKQVRSMEKGALNARPIIVISANAMGDDVKRCFEVGANDVMSKPLKLEDLRGAIKKWVLRQETPAPGDSSRETGSSDEIVDLSVLRETVGDNRETHRQLLSAYMDDLPQALDDIQSAFTRRDFALLGECSHKLKSSTRGMGAIRLANIFDTLELASRPNNWDEVESAMPQLLSLAAEMKDFVEVFCSDDSSDVTTDLTIDGDVSITEINLSILLVDDDPIMHRVSTLILDDLGINDVHSAMSGPKALEMIGQNSEFDVVICDLNMPEMDGIEFIRHLATQSFSGSLVLTSGEDIRILRTVEKLAIEHDLNMLGVLHKPVTAAKIIEILDLLEQATMDGTVLSTEVYEVSELSEAINNDQLDTYFQPKVDVKTGQVVGAEALVRWNHPSQGLIRPSTFVTLAEENNLIMQLTEAVCSKALQHTARINSHGYKLGMALNISVDTLKDLSWPDKIAKQIESAGLKPSEVTFEITESRLMEDIAVALDILNRLSLKRFNLAIDDFGTGYSSMEQLQRIPFSELKIDRAFVKGASADSSARAILESSVQLARKLDMKIVAEGVESLQDWDLVAELGCDQVQGYFIARPMPVEQFIEWLSQWNINDHLRAMR